MILYQLTLPKTKNADEFVRFMKEEYFPSLHWGPTRIGVITGLSLFQKRAAASHSFLWKVNWNGLPDRDPRLDDEAVKKKLEGFGVKIKRLGDFEEVAVWLEKKK